MPGLYAEEEKAQQSIKLVDGEVLMNQVTDAILSGHHKELRLPIGASLVDQYRRELQRRPETLMLQLNRIDSLIDCLPANAGVCANAVELLLQI